MNDLPEYLKVSQVAELFQVTPYTVRDWLKDSNHPLEGQKFGKSWRIHRDDVKKFAQFKYGGSK